MAEAIRVGILGGGWPGKAHAKGLQAAGGFKITAIADLIPARRQQMMTEFSITGEFADANDLLADKNIDAVSICLPAYLHAPVAIAALKSGKHVLCEKPPGISLKEAKQIETAANRAQKQVLYAMQRRFGGNEQAARQAIGKGYIGTPYHARATWTRTRGIPVGTGWYTDRAKSGGGAMIDIGLPMLDVAWQLLGQPVPTSAFAVSHRRLAPNQLKEKVSAELVLDVEDSSFAIIRFENGTSLELASSWALNQPPSQNGANCRIYGEEGAVEVYTGAGAVVHRDFNEKGDSKETPLKPPKTVGHIALMKHFRECITQNTPPTIGPKEGVILMQMIDAIYRSSESGKSVNV